MREIENKEYGLQNKPEYSDGKASINQKNSHIDDRNLKLYLQRRFSLLTPEEIDGEIAVYHKKIEPNLSDEGTKKIFDILRCRYFVKGKLPITSLYEELCYEIAIKKEIVSKRLQKLNPDTRKLVEVSLERILPSIIKEGLDKGVYNELVSITNPEEKSFILKCFEDGGTPNLVKEAYADYQCIETYTEGFAKDLAMAYIKRTNRAGHAVAYFGFFQIIEGYGEDTVKYILKLINKSDTNTIYFVEDLYETAYHYNELIKKIMEECGEDTVKYILKLVDENDKIYPIDVLYEMAQHYNELNN